MKVPHNVRKILAFIMLFIVCYNLYYFNIISALFTGVFLTLCFYDILLSWRNMFKISGTKKKEKSIFDISEEL